MVEGRYFLAHSTRFVAARAAAIDARMLRILDEKDATLAEFPARQLRFSARLGRLTRRIDCPDGSRFESDDNDGVDALCRALRRRGSGSIVDRMERSWRWIATAVGAAVLLSFAFVEYGIPQIARRLADATPRSVTVLISEQTLDILDRGALAPSALSLGDRRYVQTLFDAVARSAGRGLNGYRLDFRSGPAIGANAFALPDGTVVMTDELWKLVRNDAEIEGVFAHEMSHVDHAHGLQRVYQASLIPAVIAVITGDVSQVSQLATILPGILVESAYSRGFEQQADDDAAAEMRRLGLKPSHLGDLLERLEAITCRNGGCGPSWLGSHPETDLRVMKLRAETNAPGVLRLR